MRKRCCCLPLFAVALLGQESPGTGVRIIFGLGDTEPSSWNGSVTTQGAQVTAIDPWRFEGADAAAGNRWQVQLHNIRLFGNGGQFNLPRAPMVANGVIVRLSNANPDVAVHIETQQGNFDLRLADIPYGKAQYALNGRVMSDRIPPARFEPSRKPKPSRRS